MKFRLFFLLVVFWCLPSLASSQDRLAALLSGFTSYSAQFTQETYTHQQKTRVTTGKVVLLRPGYFRWTIDTPLNQSIIATPHDLWIYDVDLVQATHSHISDEDSSSPARLLSGSNQYIQSQFKITQYTKMGSQEQFHLVPKQPNANFSEVQLMFKNNELVGMRYKNNIGETNQLTFTDIKLNPPISPQAFTFTPPKAVDVLDQ